MKKTKIIQEDRKSKFRKVRETFNEIKFKKVITNIKCRKDKINDIVEIVEKHKNVLKSTTLKPFNEYRYFKEETEVSRNNFTFWDAFFFYSNVGWKTFFMKKKSMEEFLLLLASQVTC
jgi:hypothetical protein